MTIIIIDLCFYERALRKFRASRIFQILITSILYPSHDDFDINQMSMCTVCLPMIKNHMQNVISLNPFTGGTINSIQFTYSFNRVLSICNYLIKDDCYGRFSLDMEASVKTLDVK